MDNLKFVFFLQSIVWMFIKKFQPDSTVNFHISKTADLIKIETVSLVLRIEQVFPPPPLIFNYYGNQCRFNTG